MAKWYGKIGFAVTTDKGGGIWSDEIVERSYRGDLTRTNLRYQQSGNIIDNITVNNTISIVMDLFANDNLHAIRYVEFMGAKWKVSSIDVQPPRLTLMLGEVYNGQ